MNDGILLITKKRKDSTLYFTLWAVADEFCYACKKKFVNRQRICCTQLDGKTWCNTECLKTEYATCKQTPNAQEHEEKIKLKKKISASKEEIRENERVIENCEEQIRQIDLKAIIPGEGR
jgi:hypothetical protein